MDEHLLIDDTTARAIVAAYQRGDKVQDIQQQFGIARATIYYVLEKAEVTPNRVKRGIRLTGDSQQLAQLYDLVNAQNARILQLEDLCRRHGIQP